MIKIYPGSVYTKLIILAEYEHLWKSPTKIYQELLKKGHLSINTDAKGATQIIRNQIRVLEEIKAIFNENKNLLEQQPLSPLPNNPIISEEKPL